MFLLIKIKQRSFDSSEHINERRDGPYHGFGYLSLFSDPLDLANWSQRQCIQLRKFPKSTVSVYDWFDHIRLPKKSYQCPKSIHKILLLSIVIVKFVIKEASQGGSLLPAP